MTAAERAGLKPWPFHPFVTFDTRRAKRAGAGPDGAVEACIAAGAYAVRRRAGSHSALYDTEQTDRLCLRDRESAGSVWAAGPARSHPGDKKSDSPRSRFFTDQGITPLFGSSVWYFAAVSLIQLLRFTALVRFDVTISQPPPVHRLPTAAGKSASWRI